MWKNVSKKLERLLIVVVMGAAVMLGGCGGSNEQPYVYIDFVYPDGSISTGYSRHTSDYGANDIYISLDGNIAQFRSSTNVNLDGDETWEVQCTGSPTITSISSVESGTNISSMSFTPTQLGICTIVFSFSDFGTIRTSRVVLHVVQADAGPDNSAFIGNQVALEGNSLVYNRVYNGLNSGGIFSEWSPISYPAGGLRSVGSMGLQDYHRDHNGYGYWHFHPQAAGQYVFKLTLHTWLTCTSSGFCSDIYKTISEDTVTITVIDHTTPPIANAGSPQTVAIGDAVTLNGSASSDTNNLPLTYSWNITSMPVGSAASLTNATTVNPSFTADVAGDYVFSLTVNNGYLSSTSASVTITASPSVLPNNAPVANAGPDQSITVGNLVTLDGSASSDADGDTITYAWGIISAPSGSSAVLNNDTSVSPTFTPYLVGDYVIDLDVYDGITWSQIDTITVTANPSGGGTATYVTDTISLLQNNTFLVSHSSAPNGLLEVFEFGPVGPGGSLAFTYIDTMPMNRTSTWNVVDGGGFAMASEAVFVGARYLNAAAPVDSTDMLTMTGYEGYSTGLAGTSVESWLKAATVTAADFNGKTVVDYIDSTIQYVFTTATTGEYTAGTVNSLQTFTWAIDSGGHKAVLTFSNGSTHSLYLTVRQAGFTTVREMGIVSANSSGFVSGGSLKSWRW